LYGESGPMTRCRVIWNRGNGAEGQVQGKFGATSNE
jgi:hypothetical protein